MSPSTSSLIALVILNTVQASLFPIFPVQSDTCAVLRDCQIKWRDDSNLPSTATMGETTIDLVMGNASNLLAVQNLGGVANPSVATAITIQPIAGLSPTEKYAVRFIAKNNPSKPIFSTWFTITGGSGTAKPLSTPNTALAASVSGSPAPIIGSKAPNTANVMAATNSSSAAAHADKSAASSLYPSFAAITGFVGMVSSIWFF